MITQTFESSSTTATYHAQLNPVTGESSCTCPAWRFKRGDKPRTCKHVQQLAAQAGTATSARATFIELPPVVTPTGGPASAPLKPMLASAMTKTAFADHCNPSWVLEEKFDGIRVIIRKTDNRVTAWSRPRSGKDALVRELPPRLVAALSEMPDGLYDGELVTAGGRSWDVARIDTEKTLVLFDVCQVLGQSVTAKPYTERREYLRLAVEHVKDDRTAIAVPAAVPVSFDTVAAIWANGGEGAILKRAAATYQPGKRSADWVKVKKTGSAVLTLTGFEEGKNGPYSVMKLRAEDGQDTTVKTLTNKLLVEIAAAPETFIGRRVVIAYCELTDTGKFRHGIFDHFAGTGE